LFLLFSLCAAFISESLLAQTRRAGAESGALRDARLPGEVWVPPDIDATVPTVTTAKPCSLPDVLSGAGKRIQELVTNLDRFTATEFVEHQSVNGAGKLAKVEARKFDYLVSIAPLKSGYFSVQEYRSHVLNDPEFPDYIATQGLSSLVLVFHPAYARDFDMKCEGLGAWQGQSAWQVRFEERRDPLNPMSAVIVKDRLYSVRLRGRAWIIADSYQVVHLETDLADAIPAIKLRLEHMNVDYRPVAFQQNELWLPAAAELFMDFAGHRFYRKHSFTNFTLFSVGVNQQILLPAVRE
jgi:hypothetical protein